MDGGVGKCQTDGSGFRQTHSSLPYFRGEWRELPTAVGKEKNRKRNSRLPGKEKVAILVPLALHFSDSMRCTFQMPPAEFVGIVNLASFFSFCLSFRRKPGSRRVACNLSLWIPACAGMTELSHQINNTFSCIKGVKSCRVHNHKIAVSATVTSRKTRRAIGKLRLALSTSPVLSDRSFDVWCSLSHR